MASQQPPAPTPSQQQQQQQQRPPYGQAYGPGSGSGSGPSIGNLPPGMQSLNLSSSNPSGPYATQQRGIMGVGPAARPPSAPASIGARPFPGASAPPPPFAPAQIANPSPSPASSRPAGGQYPPGQILARPPPSYAAAPGQASPSSSSSSSPSPSIPPPSSAQQRGSSIQAMPNSAAGAPPPSANGPLPRPSPQPPFVAAAPSPYQQASASAVPTAMHMPRGPPQASIPPSMLAPPGGSSSSSSSSAHRGGGNVVPAYSTPNPPLAPAFNAPSLQPNAPPANGPAYPSQIPPFPGPQPNAQAGAQVNGPIYPASMPPMQPLGAPSRPPQLAPAMMTSSNSGAYLQRPQGAAGGYAGSSVPPSSGIGAPVPTSRSWAGAPPSFSGPTPPAPRPQTIPGVVPQTSAPLPPPSMGQYLAPGVSQPGSPANSAGSSSRIDPTQIPRPQTSSTVIHFETRVNGQAALPPSATSNFVVRDMGNCSPRYMRCTLNQVPCSGDLLANSNMPLALMVQPLALPHPLEEPIQIVDFGENGPVRCTRCKAYINPFMRFIDQGHHFKCNFCGQTNDTPRDYHCNLGPDNRRRDADSRPELCRGTVEFVATKEFLVRPPMSPVFFFLIDVSMNAVTTGATGAVCSAVLRALEDLPKVPNVKVGIATFDNTLHFFNFSRAQQPSMLVVPDVQDVYTPLQSGLTVSVIEFREQLEQLLENIPSMFQGTTIADSAVGAAIKGASLAIKSNGGKLLVFQSGLPSIGFAALTARESESKKGPASNEKDQNKLWQPVDKKLKTLAIELAEFQVCCDLFITTQEYVDIASLAVVPQTTGGQIYYYHPFSATSDSAKLYNDLRWNLTRPQGMEAVMRVRCSQGLQVQDYFGNFHKGTPTDLDLPAVDCDKTIMVTFKHDEKLQDGSECCFQCALLYTTIDGQRRIRITTLSVPCTTVLSNIFRGADLDAQFTYFLKHAAQEASTTPLAQLREKMTNSCVNILYTYRKFCATASSSGQLILPEALKLLPLYTLALIKSIGLRPDARTDDRCYWLSHVSSISTALSIPTVYPRMFSIHDLSTKTIGDGAMPEALYLSSENLNNEGIYLLETGEDAFIFPGRAVSPDILFQLFGVRSVNEIQAKQFVLEEFDNDASRKLVALVNEIRKERCSYLRFWWCRRGDPLEFLFLSLLVEDKNALGLSYVEYLVYVHRQIQTKST